MEFYGQIDQICCRTDCSDDLMNEAHSGLISMSQSEYTIQYYQQM